MKKINLYIFSRRPEISVGKVRLKKKVGKIIGANIYLYNLLKTIRIFYKDKRINLKICVNPDKATKEWPRYIFPKIERIPQGKGDIGIKMWNIINYDKKAKIIIGGDIQNIRSQYIIDAWKKLKNLDIIFGPSEDGGFWLIGVSKIRKLNFIFHDIDWNADNTLSQVIFQIPPNISVGFANTLKDID